MWLTAAIPAAGQKRCRNVSLETSNVDHTLTSVALFAICLTARIMEYQQMIRIRRLNFKIVLENHRSQWYLRIYIWYPLGQQLSGERSRILLLFLTFYFSSKLILAGAFILRWGYGDWVQILLNINLVFYDFFSLQLRNITYEGTFKSLCIWWNIVYLPQSVLSAQDLQSGSSDS